MGNVTGLVQDDDACANDVHEAIGSHVLENLCLTTFDDPGLGEAVRVALLLAGAAHCDDERVAPSDWPALRPKTPWLSLPVLTLRDGSAIGQTQSILRWIGAEACPRLYPQDPLLAARADELMDGVNDAHARLVGAGAGLEQRAQAAARAAALAPAGAAAPLVAKIDSFIATHGEDGHAVGDALTIADIKVWWFANFLASGFLHGVPPGALDKYAHIQAVRSAVGSLPKVKRCYAARALEGSGAAVFGRPSAVLCGE